MISIIKVKGNQMTEPKKLYLYVNDFMEYGVPCFDGDVDIRFDPINQFEKCRKELALKP